MSDLLTDPTLAPQVLARLTAVADQPLPTRGFLAGGAVANTILALCDGTDYPVNDLDLFVPCWNNRTAAPLTCRPSHHVTLELSLDDYGHLTPFCKGSYRLLRTSRRGLLNTIYIAPYSPPRSPAGVLLRLVVDGFDLNACQAGLDLASGELYLAPAFIRFVAHRQLLAVNAYTPLHTTIRLAKKRADLGCALDLAAEAAFLGTLPAVVEQCNPPATLLVSPFAPLFGAKHARQFEAQAAELEPHCRLQPLAALPLTTAETFGVSGVLVAPAGLYRLDYLAPRTAEFLALADQLADRPPLPGRHHPPHPARKFLAVPALYAHIWHQYYRCPEPEPARARLLFAFARPQLAVAALALPAYTAAPFDPGVAARLDARLTAFPLLARLLGPDLATQCQSLLALEAAEAAHGQLALGLLLRGPEPPVPLTADWLAEQVDVFKRETLRAQRALAVMAWLDQQSLPADTDVQLAHFSLELLLIDLSHLLAPLAADASLAGTAVGDRARLEELLLLQADGRPTPAGHQLLAELAAAQAPAVQVAALAFAWPRLPLANAERLSRFRRLATRWNELGRQAELVPFAELAESLFGLEGLEGAYLVLCTLRDRWLGQAAPALAA